MVFAAWVELVIKLNQLNKWRFRKYSPYICRKLTKLCLQVFNYFCLLLDLSSPQSRPQSTSFIIFNGCVRKINTQFKSLGAGRRLWDLLCGKLAFIHPESYPKIAMVTFCNNNTKEVSSVSKFAFCLLFFI